jgi:transcriptional regulator GlxA family with amidase domain
MLDMGGSQYKNRDNGQGIYCWKFYYFRPKAGGLPQNYGGRLDHGKSRIILSLIDVTYNHDGLLNQVDALVDETPRMRLSEIARALGVDRHTIENAMISRRKVTFREYKRRRLLQAARKMLDQPHLSVKEIGITLGYSSAASFSRFVQQSTGKSPSELRNGEAS